MFTGVVSTENAVGRPTAARPAATLPEEMYPPGGTGFRRFNLIPATQQSCITPAIR